MSSEADASTQPRTDLPDTVIRAQLERILASEVFSRSPHGSMMSTFDASEPSRRSSL